MIKKIPYINIIKQTKKEKKEIFTTFNKLFLKGDFILGSEVDIFEKQIENFLRVKIICWRRSTVSGPAFGMADRVSKPDVAKFFSIFS